MFSSTQRNRRCLHLTSLFAMAVVAVTSCSGHDVYTSTNKILELASSENILLKALENYISIQNDNLKVLSQFLLERSQVSGQSDRKEEDLQKLAEHPNGAYYIIKQFTRLWTNKLQIYQGLEQHFKSLQFNLPYDKDFRGSLGSLIRLQRVYRLSVDRMFAGDYLGHQGPALQLEDAFMLGQQAFMHGYLNESIAWLQLSVSLQSKHEQDGQEGQKKPLPMLAQAISLLGRAYLFSKDHQKAQELYEQASVLDPAAGDLRQLKKELDGETVVYGSSEKSWDHNMTELCLRDKHQRLAHVRPIHVCRYKMTFGRSYLFYKEEILSIEPYVSLFYDVVTDHEIDIIKNQVKGNLRRASVGHGKNSAFHEIRTSDLGWIHDIEHGPTARVSQRVKIITGLEVDQRAPHGPSSAEAMQVVNYGLGGHYGAHVDPFDAIDADNVLLNRSGFRIATFLIYLSYVEKGGNTVFLKSGISVAPKKSMALFWYNFTPAMNQDMMTEHAGCPVLIGQKWIANKWIWTYGNTFRRPCGPHPNSNQIHVERLLQPNNTRPFLIPLKDS